MILKNIKPEDILFLDIETVPQYASYDDVPDDFRKFWDAKAARLMKTDADTPSSMYQTAGIYAEFGRIVCISVGKIVLVDGVRHFKEMSFVDDDEEALLNSFGSMLCKFEKRPGAKLCAHNGKEFDFPYIARRMLVHGIELPEMLNVAGKKPWETDYIDTMELWKFGDYKNFTSLNLLTYIFGIPSPKDDIDGSQVADCYYRDHDLQRIGVYCEKDVLAIAQLMLRYKLQPLIEPQNVEHLSMSTNR